MNAKSILNKALLSTSLFIILGATAQVSAASDCKGLENSACQGATSCSWVEGYERKDGRTVKSFCRTKASARKTSVADESVAKESDKNSKR